MITVDVHSCKTSSLMCRHLKETVPSSRALVTVTVKAQGHVQQHKALAMHCPSIHICLCMRGTFD